MNHRWILIDGYSLIHRDPVLSSYIDRNLDYARRQLVVRLEGLTGVLADRISVVFDGRGKHTERDRTATLEVLFAPAHETADTVIATMLVKLSGSPDAVLLVSNDRAVLEHGSVCGVETMSCGSFLEWVETASVRPVPRGDRSRPDVLGDLFPDLFPGDRNG